ncbi:MAG: hypothetical protein FWG55_03285 [Candidatus Bathyarchaeota archaeon]|nr:hypothetical protein [Candidatus Termiticorpusculum sp.]
MKPARKNRRSSIGAAIGFFVIGVLLLAFSVLYNWQITSFIGLGLILWGTVFSLAQPGKYVEGSILDSTANTVYSTLDRLINDLKFNGNGYYIPSYPQNAYLPEYYKNLKDSIVFIADENFNGLPAIEEVVSGKFISNRDRGVFITSPGSGILHQIENQLNIDSSTVPLTELCNILPRYMTEFFSLAKNMDLQIIDDSTARLSMSGILYESLYNPENMPKSVSLLGCPVISAVASALAKSSGKTVIIKEQQFWPNMSGVDVVFNFVKE